MKNNFVHCWKIIVRSYRIATNKLQSVSVVNKNDEILTVT